MWRESLLKFMEENRKPEWRYAHSWRIYHLSKELDVNGECDDDILFAVAMLHDIGAYPKYKEEGVDHPVTSRKFAERFLEEIGFPATKMAVAMESIDKHMFNSEPGGSMEAVIVRDADILDFLGIVGVARAFLKAQDDLRMGHEELQRLAQTLPDMVVTEKARSMAWQRRREMEEFLEKLREQTIGGQFM